MLRPASPAIVPTRPITPGSSAFQITSSAPAERRIDADVVDADEPGVAAWRERGFEPALGRPRPELQRHDVDVVVRARALRFDDLRRRGRPAIVRTFTGETPSASIAAEEAGEDRIGHRPGRQGRELAVDADADARERTGQRAHAATWPNRWAAGSSGPIRAATAGGSAGALTAFRTMPRSRNSHSASTVSMPTRSCPSRVDAAMCGVAMTCGSDWSVRIGRRLDVEDVDGGAAEPVRT